MSSPSDDDRTVIRPATPPGASAGVATGGVLSVGTALGEFVIVKVIGEGGFGIVYEAIDSTLQRRVAIKEFMPSSLAARGPGDQVSVKAERHRATFDTALRSFVNEARLLAHFDHPALVKVHRFWEANGTAYMVMPLYDGVTLLATLRNASTAPPETLLMTLLGPLTEALLVLHEQQCFHRDISPDNILLLAGNGQPLLLDFGAARRVISDMKHALTVILKPGYAPIEQYAETPGLRQGPWTDVYALAAVVYFAIAGRTPPPAVSRLVEDQYEPAARVAAGRYSAAFLEAVDRALAVLPAQRTQSIEDFRSQLGFAREHAKQDSGWSQFGDSATADEAAPSPRADDAPPKPSLAVSRIPKRPVVGRSRRLWAAGLALLTAIVGSAAFYQWRDRSPKPPVPMPPVPTLATPTTTPTQPVDAPPITRDTAPVTLPSALDPFEHIVSHQSPEFLVTAQPSKLRLRINIDRLTFTVKSSQDGFVHVLMMEPDGTVLLVFPNAKSARNQITAGKPMSLPQEQQWHLWALEPPGSQRFLVVVSSQAHDFSTLKIAQKGDFVQLDHTLISAGGAMLPGRAACDGVGCNPYGTAAFDVSSVRR